LHKDNAPVLFVCHFLAEKLRAVFKLAPHSPELATGDFFLLTKLKILLKGTHFQSTEAIHNKTQLLKALIKCLQGLLQGL
jgi:hypothetical protein